MKEMKNRLIESMKKTVVGVENGHEVLAETIWLPRVFEAMADKLLEGTVVVPPVEVGQKVWYIRGGYYDSPRKEPREITVTEINKKKSGKTVEWAFIANRTRYRFSSIGKSVFLSREDCEAALAERSEG